MINQFQLIRNVGRFDSITPAANTQLSRLSLIYAENGRGKTTMAAIFRSLSSGDPIPVVERRRLAAQNPPHVIISCAGGPQPAMFQNGAWTRTLPTLVVFDDVFVDQNVYSGLVVGVDHRQKLHELILGARGVALNQQHQELIARVEAHNRQLRQREAAIPVSQRGTLSVDEFCALAPNANVEQEILAADRHLAAAREQEPVRTTPEFDLISLPSLDLVGIETVLRTGMPDLDAAAAARVQAHVATAGRGAEEWIAAGMRRQDARPAHLAGECVFCAQDLSGSPVIPHYRAFFSAAYQRLQQSIVDAASALDGANADAGAASFERAVRILGERRVFWARFADMPEVQLDTASIVRDWQAARAQLAELLARKRASPLEPAELPEVVRAAVQRHSENRDAIAALNQRLTQANQVIAAVKQRAAGANPAGISASLMRLRAVRDRHSPATAPLCDAYQAERQAKAATEQLRDQARAALEQYRTNVFPSYQAAINRYLTRFNAGFSLDSVAAANTRGGPTCTYNVVINNTPVPVAGGALQPGDHSFKNTLSAGDRNTLALAFFFASLDLDPNPADKVVVIDDPVSSLDEHRSLTTVQEMRRLAARVAQVIVLSHSKPFLCRIWEGADPGVRSALRVLRDGAGSTIETWNVDADAVTEHDRRHTALCEYAANGGQNEREIAGFIRPHLEAFFRVAYPEHFPPGTLLGQFRTLCDRRVNTPQPILNANDIHELRDIVEYANRFHHDTNPAWAAEVINANELAGFVTRTLTFAKRQ
jgi:wobble nucleotide-excising tRNase